MFQPSTMGKELFYDQQINLEQVAEMSFFSWVAGFSIKNKLKYICFLLSERVKWVDLDI